jgi:hypothetical protein
VSQATLLSVLGAGFLGASVALADTPASTNAAPVAAAAPAKQRAHPQRPPLYRDTTQYPPLKLAWNTDTDLNGVLGVFVHPVLPQLALVVTQSGVLGTGDAGRTWTVLAGATADKVGTVNEIAWDPVQPDTFYLASATSGIWMTTDGGKTCTQIGSKSGGLAADTVSSLCVYPGDPSQQTIVAVHGDAAPGLSWTQDGGKTWQVANDDYHFHRVIGGEGEMPDLYLTGASLKEPDIQSLYSCGTLGDYVTELVRDVVPTDLAFAPNKFEKHGTLYLATSDSGLCRLDKVERTSMSYTTTQLGSKDDSWSSVSVTWGPSADAINLYLYDSSKQGLVVTGDDLATQQTASDGLQVGSLIKEGATLRPNANGTVFYAAVNGALQIGRAPDDVPAVEVTPGIVVSDPRARDEWKNLAAGFQLFGGARAGGSAVDAAKALLQKVGDPAALYKAHHVTVSARVPTQPAPPKSVTVDLTRYGGGPNMPLFDDGQHGDGAAGDGVYANTFAFLPEMYRPRGGDPETRSVWPGRVALGVRAEYPDGHCQGAVGVVGIYSKTVDLTFWANNTKSFLFKTDGTVTAQAASNPAEIHNATMALRADTQPGSWAVKISPPWTDRDITSYAAISFWIRSSAGTPASELNIQLADEPDFTAPTVTPPVSILEGKTLGADYLHITIPLSKLIPEGSPFETKHLANVIISGKATAPATYFIDGMQVLVHDDDTAPSDQ